MMLSSGYVPHQVSQRWRGGDTAQSPRLQERRPTELVRREVAMHNGLQIAPRPPPPRSAGSRRPTTPRTERLTTPVKTPVRPKTARAILETERDRLDTNVKAKQGLFNELVRGSEEREQRLESAKVLEQQMRLMPAQRPRSRPSSTCT